MLIWVVTLHGSPLLFILFFFTYRLSVESIRVRVVGSIGKFVDFLYFASLFMCSRDHNFGRFLIITVTFVCQFNYFEEYSTTY